MCIMKYGGQIIAMWWCASTWLEFLGTREEIEGISGIYVGGRSSTSLEGKGSFVNRQANGRTPVVREEHGLLQKV